MKIVKMLVLVSSLFAVSAYAQSSIRGDEFIKNPSQYRLGDSDDLQADQMIVDQNKVCNVDKKEVSDLSNDQQEILIKHLIKYDI